MAENPVAQASWDALRGGGAQSFSTMCAMSPVATAMST